MLTILGGLAEFECELILARTNDGTVSLVLCFLRFLRLGERVVQVDIDTQLLRLISLGHQWLFDEYTKVGVFSPLNQPTAQLPD
jgi:hypothetical protein